MKLKNKKTGEIVEWFNDTNGVFPDSLAELNEEWEDVFTEEVWYLGERIGNYSMPKKEAIKATEKILAWKRLKDKGFEFINFPYKKICKYDARTGVGNLEYQVKYYEELEQDLDLLFCTEENS